MHRVHRRFLILLASLPVLLVLLAILYQLGMMRLEGQPRGFWDAVGWAAETLTTTGYGYDEQWAHPLMVVFVVIVQFVGVFLVFLIVPVYLIPFLEERFESRVPHLAPPMDDHVVVYRYGPAVETLLDLLDSAAVPFVVVEREESEARRAQERGVPVVYSPTEDGALSAGRIEQARALVANGRDEENAAIILGARQIGFDGDIVALVEEPMHRHPIAAAGATAVFTPHHMLAAALAARASDQISPRLSGLGRLGPLAVQQIRVDEGSALAGRTLREVAIGERAGVTVIGQWVAGDLTPLESEGILQPRGILVVVGSEAALERVAELFEGSTPLRRQGPHVIIGFGEVGKKVHQLLTDVGEDTWVVDLEGMPGVDVVGTVLAPDVIERARVEEARDIIVALDSDELTLFTTVLVKESARSAPVIARVNKASNVDTIHRAGADFALSVSQVSGQMLGRRLLGEEIVSFDSQLRLAKMGSEGLEGRHPVDLAIRERTGCSVVAVARGDDVLVDFSSAFRFERDDGVYVAGSKEAIQRYRRELSPS